MTEPKKAPPPPTQKFAAQFLEMIITIPLCWDCDSSSHRNNDNGDDDLSNLMW